MHYVKQEMDQAGTSVCGPQECREPRVVRRLSDVDFKLHAPERTTIEGTVRGGRVVDLKVTPESRRADVVFANTN
jgi:hypothetical protein